MSASDLKTIVTIVGARPQFIKAAAVSRAIKKSGLLKEVLVHSGQHYDHNMSDIFFQDFGISPPDYNLGIPGGTHGAATGRMLEALEAKLIELKPDGVLVYGDTNTSLAAALAAVKLHIPVFHVEAGPRVYDLKNPEDVNRRMIDHISELLFAPTQQSMECLDREGLSDRAHFVGDVMFDTLLQFEEQFKAQSSEFFPGKPYILMTMHREENTKSPEEFSGTVNTLASFGIPVLFPMHPRTRKFVETNNIGLPANIKVIEPLGYLDLMREVSNCLMVATDSGGLQKESFFLGKHAIVLQENSGLDRTVRERG